MADFGAAQLPLNVPDGLDAGLMSVEFSTVVYGGALMPEYDGAESTDTVVETGQLYPR